MSTVIEVRNLRKTTRSVTSKSTPSARSISPLNPGSSRLLWSLRFRQIDPDEHAGCLDQPTAGEYLLDGVNVSTLTPDQRADIRNQKIGFVFQGLICYRVQRPWKTSNCL
jgi:hypothetical protein